jgi:predicted metal-dependent phosphotriesterase family hydrolase
VVLSHDAVTEFNGPAEIAAHTFSDYTFIANTFLPALKDAGVDDPTINLLVRENPRRIFSYPDKGGAR